MQKLKFISQYIFPKKIFVSNGYLFYGTISGTHLNIRNTISSIYKATVSLIPRKIFIEYSSKKVIRTRYVS